MDTLATLVYPTIDSGITITSNCLPDDLYCVGGDVKPYSLTHSRGTFAELEVKMYVWIMRSRIHCLLESCCSAVDCVYVI